MTLEVMKKKRRIFLLVVVFLGVLYYGINYIFKDEELSNKGMYVDHRKVQNIYVEPPNAGRNPVQQLVRDGKREVISRSKNHAKHRKKSVTTVSHIRPTTLPEIEQVVGEELTKIVGPPQQLHSTGIPTEIKSMPYDVDSFEGYALEKALESLPLVDKSKIFLKELQCTNLSLRHIKHETAPNITCKPHRPQISDCLRADRMYKRKTKVRKCKGEKPSRDLCVFIDKWRTSSDAMIRAECDLTPCGENPVHLIPFDKDFGILSSMDKWLEFSSAETLQSYLPGFVAKYSSFGLQFSYLRCRKPKAKVFIKQILAFPPLVENSSKPHNDDLINFNFINLKSVSRAHFYRSLPKTIATMRRIARDVHVANATVLDYELMQSSASESYHNIKGFISGREMLEYDENKQDFGIAWFYGFLKNKGYYTVLQDDTCWYDEWGTIFSNYAYQNKTPNTLLEFAQHWDYFNDVIRSANIDDMGLSNTACDVYKQYKTTNQLQEKNVCFAGKPYAEYFLNYTTNILQLNRVLDRKRPIFSFTNLGAGDEMSGTRIRQIDDSLSKYVKTMARDNDDTLTVIFSDHGPKSTKYSLFTPEGRAEMYDALLFVILPKKVAEKLHFTRARALITNQFRLVTTSDLHDAVMSVIDSTHNIESSPGLFGEIPPTRDCSNLVMKPTAICKCENWYEKYPDNHAPFTWLAELGLGEINNAIQEEYSANNEAGFGKCQRLVGYSFKKIRYRKEDNKQVVTMDIFVKPQMEAFELQIKYPVSPRGNTRDNIEVSALHRISSFNIYKDCKDEDVPLDLCICRPKHHRYNWTWIKLRSKNDMLQVIARSTSFGSKLSTKNLHDNCLLLLLRKHDERTEVYEIANICKDRMYNIRLAGRSKTRSITSRNLPLAKMLKPLTVHFLFSVYHLKTPYGFYVKTSYKLEIIK